MRIVFKTSYDADLGLFVHRHQAFWYFLLLAGAVGLPFVMNDFWIGEVALMLITANSRMGHMHHVGQAAQPILGHA
ncbi:MAG: branched-chain amino acid ABC transporter permease, partial [Boseongicola sp. SB0676_bin_33]|nr:branched-chain amino acid ABC transporter permease [Boseongicola sp. SB0676_bin_33]